MMNIILMMKLFVFPKKTKVYGQATCLAWMISSHQNCYNGKMVKTSNVTNALNGILLGKFIYFSLFVKKNFGV
jgi:hypothetical protein